MGILKKRKKLRKSKTLRGKKGLLLVVLMCLISVGFSTLTTSLSISGLISVKKKLWNATEVEYKTSYTSTVNTVHDALLDLSKLIKGTKHDASEVEYKTASNTNIKTVKDALDDLRSKMEEKNSNG